MYLADVLMIASRLSNCAGELRVHVSFGIYCETQSKAHLREENRNFVEGRCFIPFTCSWPMMGYFLPIPALTVLFLPVHQVQLYSAHVIVSTASINSKFAYPASPTGLAGLSHSDGSVRSSKLAKRPHKSTHHSRIDSKCNALRPCMHNLNLFHMLKINKRKCPNA